MGGGGHAQTVPTNCYRESREGREKGKEVELKNKFKCNG